MVIKQLLQSRPEKTVSLQWESVHCWPHGSELGAVPSQLEAVWQLCLSDGAERPDTACLSSSTCRIITMHSRSTTTAPLNLSIFNMDHISWCRCRQTVNRELSMPYQNVFGRLPGFLKSILLLNTGAKSLNFFFPLHISLKRLFYSFIQHFPSILFNVCIIKCRVPRLIFVRHVLWCLVPWLMQL